jgi:hypothetical protein
MVSMDYSTKEISLPTLQNKIPFKLITDNDPDSLTNSLNNLSMIPVDILIMYEQPIPFKPGKNIALHDIPLNNSQQNLMSSLLQKYQYIFKDKPGLHSFFSYKFNVRIHESYKIKPYSVPFSRRPAVQKEIDKMNESGVIERSDSPYNNPLVTVIKVDGSIRLCLDARKLNTIILPIRNASPPLLMIS